MAHRRENKSRPSELEASDKENKRDKVDRKRKKASSSSGTSSDSSSGSESSSGSSSSGSSTGSSSKSSSTSSTSSSSGYSDGVKRKKTIKKVSKSPSATRGVVDKNKKTKAVRERDDKTKKPEKPTLKTRPDRSTSPPRRKRSPTPRPTKIHVGRLSRNVTRDHVREIFSTFGNVKAVDFPLDRNHPSLGKGFAYAEFETADDAENAMKHMDGGEITAAPVAAPLTPARATLGWGADAGLRLRDASPARRRRYSRSSSSTSR